MRNNGFNPHDIFGNRRPRTRGDDIRHGIQVGFMEAVKGCVKKIAIDYPSECLPCKGNGSKSGSGIEQCKHCNGVGKVGYNQGAWQILRTCPGCQGVGHKILEKCPECAGNGFKTKTEIIKITIPAGIEHGTVMRLSGKGMPSPYGAENGDLYLSIMTSPHPKFKREGATIYSDETVNYIDAILGTKLSVNTVHGNVKLTVPQGTQPNSILKIKGKGVHQGKNKGNHLVSIKVSMPKQISKEEKELLEKLKGGKP